jgi:excisionase family DNA binding protein
LDKNTSTNNEIMTAGEVARLLRLNRATVYKGLREGTIPSVRVGDRFLIPRARLDAWLAGGANA